MSSGHTTAFGNGKSTVDLLQAELEAIYNSAPVGLCVFDTELRYLRINERLAGMNGFPAAEHIGRTVREIMPDLADQAEHIAKKIIETGLPVDNVEFTGTTAARPDLLRTWLENWSPIKDTSGRVIGINVVAEEVTELRQTEETLRESEAGFRSLFETMNEGFALHEIITDEEGRSVDYRFLEVNQAFERMTGLRRADLIGKRVLEVLPDTEQYWIENYGRVAVKGEPVRFESYSAALGRWYEVSAYQNAPRQFAVLCTDISKRKKDEERERLEHRETAFANRVLRAFVEFEDDTLFDRALAIVEEEMSSRHGVFGYVPEPGHLFCPSLSKMLDTCEIEGKCIHYPPEKWKGLWAKALTEKRSLYTNKAPPVPPGHPIIHNNLAAPILFNGEAIGLLNIANKDGGYTDADRDTLDRISDRVAPVLYAWVQRKLREDMRKAAEEELRESRNDLKQRVKERTADLEKANYRLKVYNRQLEQLNKELQDFTFVASHDLQEPLRKVRTFGTMLAAKSALDEVSIDYVRRMQSAAERMQDLLNSLLSYTRVTTKAKPVMETNLNKSVEIALSNLEIEIKGKNACIEVDDLPTIIADRVQMIQLFQNIIHNAVKFQNNDQLPRVKVYAQRGDQNAVRICVEDNGIGFDERFLNKIFFPFQRLHGRSSDYKGEGMGLAICKKIVERHGGEITTKSELGKGSTFIVTLPVEVSGQ